MASQVKKNLLFNIISLFINILVVIYYTPYLVDELGDIAYGVLPLAMIINQYISVLTTSLRGSLTRFYTVHLNGGQYKKASQSISVSLIVVSAIIIFCVFILTLIILKLDDIFNIPAYLLNSAKILFTFTFFSFFLSLISSFLNIVLYSKNRLDLLKVIDVLRIVSRVLSTVLLFEFIFVDIKFVGIAGFIAEVMVLLVSYYFFVKNLHSQVKVNLKNINLKNIYPILMMTTWVIVHQIGDLGIYKTDILFVNKFWSTTESGILGAISNFSSYVMLLIGVISSLFGPLILIAYSNKNHQEVMTLALKNSLLIGLLTSLVISLLIGFSYEFLTLWLNKPLYAERYSWLDYKLLSLPFYAASGVFAFVYRSWNKVKKPALITLSIGFFTIISTFVVSHFSHKNLEYINYILILNNIFCFIQTYVLGFYMFKSIYKEVSWKTFFIILLKFISVIIPVVLLSRFITNNISVDSWLSLILWGGIVGSLGISYIYFVLLAKTDRNYLLKVLIKK